MVLLQGISFVTLLLSNVAILIVPALAGQLVNDGLDTGSLNPQLEKIMFALIAVSFVLTFIQLILAAYLSEKVGFEIRNDLITKITKQTYGFIEKITPSVLLTNLTSDIMNIKNFLLVGVNAAITSIILVIGSVIMMFKINSSLAVRVVLIFPILVFTFVFIIRKLIVQFGLAQKARDLLNRSIDENIKASMLVRVFVSENVEKDKFDERNVNARSVSFRIVRIFSLLVPLINIANYAAIAIVIWHGGNLIADGSFSSGALLAFYQYTQTFIFPLFMLGFIGNAIGQTVVSSKRIEAVMNAPVEFADGTKELKDFQKLEFINTSLDFNEKNKKQSVLESVNLEVNKGEKVGLIGMTGSGKSMILQLILRFFEPTAGEIKVNDVELKDYKIQSIRSKIGLVFQENFIFSGTVRENLIFGNPKITEKEMKRAAEIAEVAEFVEKMPDKYDEVIGERGINLSGGQKQRLTIARALLGKPQILILDDSTSKLDSTTEKRIFENIKEYLPDLTIIIVAQKISSVKNSDKIYVVDEGRIETSGAHEELKNKSFIYKEIELAQSNLAHD